MSRNVYGNRSDMKRRPIGGLKTWKRSGWPSLEPSVLGLSRKSADCVTYVNTLLLDATVGRVNCLFKPLAVIDAAKAETIAHLKLAGHPKSFQLEKNGGRIFVNVPDAQHIAVLDRGRGLTRKPDGAGKYRPSGVYWDPTLATKGKGQIIVEATVVEVVRQVRELVALQ
jgi:hypothetical protein